jgi:hypothetical protein
MNKIQYYLPGIFLTVSGVLIAVFPEILIALIASVVIMAGVAALFLGHRIKESGYAFNKINEDGWSNHERFQFRYHNPSRFRGRWF